MPVMTNPILVVDDEENNRDLLSRRLQRAGFTVEMAENGARAYDLIRQRDYDLILLDSMMPEMNGIDLLKLLRGSYSQSELPVIMVTALAEGERIAEALRMGANDYITKPIDFLVALARIESQLNRKRAEAALRESEERYSLAARGSNDGLWDWDLRSGTIYYSPRWKEMLGYEDNEISNQPQEWLSRLHNEDRSALDRQLQQHCAPNGPTEFMSEHRLRHKDGSYRWVLSRGIVLRDKDGTAIRMAGSQTDVTQNKVFDALTGLPNRVLFLETLERAMRQAHAEAGNEFAVLFLDLDRFKNVNDSMGHLAGDQMLVHVARRIENLIRHDDPATQQESDIVARFGGDEFAVLLHHVSSAEQAHQVAIRIQRAINVPIQVEANVIHSSVSIGIAMWNPTYTSPQDILRDADTAMYQAKGRGRAQDAVFDGDMRARAIERLELEHDLQLALTRDEFVLYYQPKIELSTTELAGFEALIRWQHPTRGLIMPNTFVPILEETGLIVQAGKWALNEACRTMKAWKDAFPQHRPMEVSVNISAKQFNDPSLLESVAEALRTTGLDASSLKLEITESVLIENQEATVDVLNRLKQMGVGLKIDDFGTGYSSLSYIAKLPCDSLKIDRSFVINLFDDPHSAEIVRAIVGLARNLNLDVVAEGIETRAQLDHLVQLGCEFGQGYYFAKPLPVSVAERLLENGDTIPLPGATPAAQPKPNAPAAGTDIIDPAA